jgi:hypothetical protein
LQPAFRSVLGERIECLGLGPALIRSSRVTRRSSHNQHLGSPFDRRPASYPCAQQSRHSHFALGSVKGAHRTVAACEEQVMFDFRLFQFRSPGRDQENDKRRIALVQKAVRSAVADAEAEVTGLRTRPTWSGTPVRVSRTADEPGRPVCECLVPLGKPIDLRRHLNWSLLATGNSAGKRFGEGNRSPN